MLDGVTWIGRATRNTNDSYIDRSSTTTRSISRGVITVGYSTTLKLNHIGGIAIFPS